MASPRRPITGSWLVTADCCGRVRHNHQVRKGTSQAQKGLVICHEHWEPEHPLLTNPPGKGLKPEPPSRGLLTGDKGHTGQSVLVAGHRVGLYADPTVPENYQTTAATLSGVTIDPNAATGFDWSPPVRLKKPDGSWQ